MRKNYRRKRRSGCLLAFIRILGVLIVFVSISVAAVIFIHVYPPGTERKDSGAVKGTVAPVTKQQPEEAGLADKYYYSQLSKEEQNIYREILAGIRKEQEEIHVGTDNPKEVNELYGKILYDFPELFWCSGNAETTSGDTESVLRCEYLYTGTEKENREKEIENATKVCLDGMDSRLSEYEKIKYVYEYIINTTDYDSKASDNQNIYSVLVNRRSVCAGYARATQYLLEKAGIFATFVTGTVSHQGDGSQKHAWNLVKCDGDYYYVDTTWGDPVFLGQDGLPDSFDEPVYDYLCCSGADLFQTHTLDEGLRMPECTSDKYNYYKQNHRYYETFEESEVLKIMKTDIQNKSGKSIFKFPDRERYDKADQKFQETLLNQAVQYLAERYGLSEVHYYYVAEEKTNKISIYWIYE